MFENFSMYDVGRDKQLVLVLTLKVGSTSTHHFCEIRVSPRGLAEDWSVLGSIAPCQLAHSYQCFEEPCRLYDMEIKLSGRLTVKL